MWEEISLSPNHLKLIWGHSEICFVVSNSLQHHGLYSLWNSPGQSTEDPLLQGIFPTQGSNPGLPHCRQILYQLSHKESPRILEWVAYPFSNRSFQPRNQTRVSCIAGRLFTNWAMREGIGLSHYISIQIGQNQIDILPVRRCRWPKSTWKDDQRH